MTTPLDPPKPPPRLRVTGLRVSIDCGDPAPATEPISPPQPADLVSLDPLAGRDLEFEAECARDQARDDLADWLAAQPGANVVPFPGRRPR